jgi:hypothetical protein
MKKFMVRAGITVSLLLVGYFAGHHTLPIVHAQQKNTTAPKTWGHCIAATTVTLVFEDSEGTIRMFNANSGKVELLVTRN